MVYVGHWCQIQRKLSTLIVMIHETFRTFMIYYFFLLPLSLTLYIQKLPWFIRRTEHGRISVQSKKIGHFRVHLSLHFKARLSAKSLLWKSVFIHIEIGTNYHNKNFALRLALKERLRGTRKWPIERVGGQTKWNHPALVSLEDWIDNKS